MLCMKLNIDTLLDKKKSLLATFQIYFLSSSPFHQFSEKVYGFGFSFNEIDEVRLSLDFQ